MNRVTRGKFLGVLLIPLFILGFKPGLGIPMPQERESISGPLVGNRLDDRDDPADLSVFYAIEPNPGVPVTVGDEVTYVIAVHNHGPDPAENVILTDYLSMSEAFANAEPTKGSCNTPPVGEVGGTVTCELGEMLNGEEETVTLTVTAANTGDLVNQVCVDSDTSDPSPGNNCESEVIQVNYADLAVAKADLTGPVTVGEQVTYEITVFNGGPNFANNVVLTDTLPASVSYTSATPEQGACTLPLDHTVRCYLQDLDPLTQIIVTIIGTATAAGTVTNNATVGSDTFDQYLDNNSADAETIVELPEADLSVTKADRVDPITVGEQVTYDITVTNHGPDLAENVVLTDNLPATVTFDSATPGCTEAGDVVTCDIGDMANGAGVTVTIIGTATERGTIINHVSVTSDTHDRDPDNNDDDEDTKVTETDLSVTKTDRDDPITVGEQVTYDLTVTNNGPDEAENVELTDNLPATVTFDSATPGCTEAGGVVACDLGDMANGASVTVTIIGTATAAGTITNNVSITSDTHDPNPGDNSDDEETKVTEADLSVDKTDLADPITVGEQVTYDIIVTNNGPDEAENVVLTDTLPGTVTFVSAIPDQGSCAEAGGVVTCDLGDMANGASVTVTIIGTATEAGTITNNVCVDSDTYDPDPSNNCDDEDTIVNELIYLSFASNGRVGGISFTDDDILEYNLTTDSWSIYFDGSDVGIYRDLDGFELRDGNILLTFDRPTKLPGLGYVAAADIVEFVPSSLGPYTSGSFNWFFDGSDVDLATGGEDIEAVTFAPDGRLVVSTAGTFIVSGLTGLRQDLLVFNDTSLGETTRGTWELYLDGSGSGVRLDTPDENIWGTWIDPDTNEIYLTTKGDFCMGSVWGLCGTVTEIFICNPFISDPVISCDPDRYWDASYYGGASDDEQIDGFSILTKIP